MQPAVTDWIGSVSASLGVVITLMATIYAALQWRTARESRLDAIEAAVQQAQPYVTVFTEETSPGKHSLDIVVKNFGTTAASNVRVWFPEKLRRATTAGTEFEFFELPVLPVLAPGQSWRTYLDTFPQRSLARLPMRYEGTVKFNGLSSPRNAAGQFESEIVLDLQQNFDRLTLGSQNSR